MYAERNAWREIHNKVYEGSSLKEALQAQRSDTLFWTREVYERLQKHQEKGSRSKAWGKGKSSGSKTPSWSPAQKHWKGKPPQSKRKPSKGGSKGKELQWPKCWATHTPKGMQYCKDHLLKGKWPMWPFPQLPGAEGWLGLQPHPPARPCPNK